MSLVKWVANAVWKRSEGARRPRPGQVVQPMEFDRWRPCPADGLTPSQLAAILRSADEGAVEQAMALFEQMEEKDAHLHAVANTRRLAVTGLPWRIVSAADEREGVDRAAADEAAAYAREVLAGIERFDAALQHLALAIGRNITLAENVWDLIGGELRLVDIVPVPCERITFDESCRPRVLTADEPTRGIELPPDKFIVHTPHAVSGHPMRGGLLRVSALAYLGKHFAMKDWMVFAELFGMPLRIARYEPSATPEEKRELLHMLQTLGTDAAAIFSKAVELQLLEAGQGKAPPPYENMCDFFNRELSKAWLGETLTVEPTRNVSGTTVEIQNQVRKEVRLDDMVKESRTIRGDVLGPIVRMHFGPRAPTPFFRRQFTDAQERQDLARLLSVAVNELGMKVPARWAHEVLGVPAAADRDTLLAGQESSSHHM
ncbi:MAG TPA: DUF935 family protein [Phycisphaerae bacterium]|nr:DUF935 family protein [Phycisphaerae bacterium]